MLTEANPDKTNAVGAVNALADEREARLDAEVAPAARRLAGAAARLRRRRVRRQGARARDPHPLDAHHPVRQQDAARSSLPALRGRRRDPQVAAARQRAGLASRTPPAPSRSSARTRTRRGCSPARATPSRPTRRFKLLSAGMPAKRLSTAFDSVTLYGNDPAIRPDIYGKVGNSGVSIATLDDMKVLYSGFDLTEPEHLGQHDDQRPGADDPGDVHQHRDRPEARRLPRRATSASRATTRRAEIAAWVKQNVRGTVQADILKEDQGQNTCIFSTEFSLKVMGDIAEYFVAPQGAQLLLGEHLRLSHRRGRREPDQPARLHALERLHLRRGLPRARHGDRRLRAQPVVLLLQRHGPGVHGDGPRGAAHLGGGDARPLRRQRAQPEAQVPRADHRAARCTRRRCSSTTSAPRCRR